MNTVTISIIGIIALVLVIGLLCNPTGKHNDHYGESDN